jgi:hypothetical protein
MRSGGPIAYATAAADGFAWARYFSVRCCRCARMGPSHMLRRRCRWFRLGQLFCCELLPMHSHGPIAFRRAAANAPGWAHCHVQADLHIASPRPITFPGAAVDAPAWAHCHAQALLPMSWARSSRCCRWARMGPRHNLCSGTAADGFTWAHYFSRRFCGCDRVGPSHMRRRCC